MPKTTIYQCPVTATLSVIGGRWKPILIYTLSNGSKRFGQLDAIITGISRKILTEQLRDLEANGLVIRKQFNEAPPRVEYSLSEKGRTLQPLMQAMCEWGNEHVLSAKGKLRDTNTKRG
ncbi:MAG: helix-turn-helix domain-containing protein [Saprospiraceae bacterium]|nr:helix-turn-helix domain-containing protein [Saprospiraceae bacterium]